MQKDFNANGAFDTTTTIANLGGTNLNNPPPAGTVQAAIDTGAGQIAFQLRQDSRVRLLEKTNARYLTFEQLGETADFIAMDVSFISAALVLPAVISAAFPQNHNARAGHELVLLIKPQFEAGREHVGKGGIVRDSSAQQQAVQKITAAVQALGATSLDVIDSPILGAEGNREFLLYGKF